VSDGPDLDEVRRRMKALGIFDHEGYSGPATKHHTVAIGPDGRFFVIGPPHLHADNIDAVIAFLLEHTPR
jgi:hypothetical protein